MTTSHRSRRRATVPVAAFLGLALSGCMLESTPILPAPVSSAEQQYEVLQIVKPGTTREEAVALLDEAGIQGSFGTTGARSVYYCDVWNREDGERWHLDVAVLFDESGRVINTRLGEATTTARAEQPNAFEQRPVQGAARPAAEPVAAGSRATSRRTAFRED